MTVTSMVTSKYYNGLQFSREIIGNSDYDFSEVTNIAHIAINMAIGLMCALILGWMVTNT
ncbi:MAG: hypothetical protein ACYDHG_11180 [Desulfomonilaceae bacterium]